MLQSDAGPRENCRRAWDGAGCNVVAQRLSDLGPNGVARSRSDVVFLDVRGRWSGGENGQSCDFARSSCKHQVETQHESSRFVDVHPAPHASLRLDIQQAG